MKKTSPEEFNDLFEALDIREISVSNKAELTNKLATVCVAFGIPAIVSEQKVIFDPNGGGVDDQEVEFLNLLIELVDRRFCIRDQ